MPGRGANRGVGHSVPVGTVTPQLRRGRGQPGQAGFVQRGARGASRSSPRLTLPSFSTEEEDDDENDEDNNDNDDDNDGDKDTDDDEEEEVDFPDQGNVQRRRQTMQGGKQPWNPIATKNLNLIRAPKQRKSSFAEIAAWNRWARQGAWNETKRGWMAKNK